MKKIIILLVYLIFTNAKAQTCSWLRGGASNAKYNESGQSMVTDKTGNVYVTGGFEAATFTLGTTVLSNTYIGSNYGGIFVAKYTPNGTLLWAKGAEGGTVADITLDNNKNVYITGTYNPSITFGTYSLKVPAVFVAKYDSLGNVLWAKNIGEIGDTGGDLGYSITTDKSNNVIVSGDFYNPTMTIGTYTLHNSTSGTSYPDYFITKLDPSGNVLWASSTGGNRYDIGNALATDAANNIYSVVNFNSDTIKFGSNKLVSPYAGSGNLAICKYDSLGNIKWAKGYNNSTLNYNFSTAEIVTDSLANLYITGEFGGSLIMGNDTVHFVNGGNTDVFIAKLDSAGNPLWAKGASSTNYDDYSRGITLDKSGNPYITGSFDGASISFGTTVLTNPNGANHSAIFVAKYNASGVAQWAITSSSACFGSGEGIAAGKGANLYVTGQFDGSTLSFPGSSLNTTGNYDYFLADIYPFTSGITSYTNVSCYGGQNGAIIANASGGNIPYSYSWTYSGLDTLVTLPYNDTLKNIPAGAYTFSVTEGYGCSQISYVTLTQPTATLTATITNVVNSTCLNNASATVSATGGTSPYTYHWSNGSTMPNDTGISAGNYSVTITDTHSCVATQTVSIINTPFASAPICMVTTDSATNFNYNVIYWDKTGYTNIDSFIIYRKDAISSGYLRIGAVSNSALSKFVDTSFSVGGPNGGNPQYSSWLYKIAMLDTCGNMSAKSPYHQSMFVQESGSNFSWNAYVDSGQVNLPTGYSFLRDDNNTGAWHVLINTSGTSATDPNYSSYPNGNWRVDAIGFNCTPTMRLSGNNSVQSTYSKSHSNPTKPTTAVGIIQLLANNSLISIYPNPSNGSFTVETYTAEKQTMQLFDVNGKLVLSQTLNGKTSIDASSLMEGVYNLSLIGNEGVVNKKLVIVR